MSLPSTGGREEKMICAFNSFSCYPKALKSLLIALDPHVAASSLPIWKSSKGLWPLCYTRLDSFPVTPLTQAPGRQQTLLRRGSAQHIGRSVPCREESPTTTIHLLSFNGVVFFWGKGFLWFGFISLSRLSGLLSVTDGPHSCWRGAPGGGWEDGGGIAGESKERFCIRLQAQTCLHLLFSFVFLPPALQFAYSEQNV